MSASKGLTGKQLAELLDKIAVYEKLFESIKRHAVERAHKGEEIPGWEPDHTTPRRAWGDEEAANTKLAALGLEKRERYTVELLSPAQAEKALRAKGKWPKKSRASDDFHNPFDGLLDNKEGNPTIKRKS